MASFLSFTTATLTLLLWLPVLGGPLPSASLAASSVAAGVALAFATMLFFRSLAMGEMAVVAPVTAVTSAAVPVIAGLGWGERPATPALVGVCCALIAIGMVSWVRPATRGTPSATLLALAIVAGTGFGLYYVLLAAPAVETPSVWPAVIVEITGTMLIAPVAMRAWGRARWSGAALRWTVASGVLGTGTAAPLFLVAVAHGPLAVLGAVASLYPASTVLLALVLDRERLARPQVIGLVLAGASLVLVGAG